MKILVISDTHGHTENLERALKRTGPVDALVHCGDVERDEDYIRVLAGCPCYMVSGNNDWFLELERELVIILDGYKIWITHGHQYGVSMGLEYLRQEGRNRGVDIVMFGHTHRPVVEESEGMVILNPGSLSYPRQQGRKPSYLLIETDAGGHIRFDVNYLN